jgi:hypothetical protein
MRRPVPPAPRQQPSLIRNGGLAEVPVTRQIGSGAPSLRIITWPTARRRPSLRMLPSASTSVGAGRVRKWTVMLVVTASSTRPIKDITRP